MTQRFPSTLRVRASFVAAGLASLLGTVLPGCIIDAKIGVDPEGGSETNGETEDFESSTSGFPGTASVTSGTASASTSTTGGDPTGSSVTATVTTADPSVSASVTSAGPGPGVDPETALELCGVVVVPVEPDTPVVFSEGIECSGGCIIDIETSVFVDLWQYGECLCEAMDCGELNASSTTNGGGDETESGGEPDGCGELPPGDAGFTCSCEMCSIDVTNVDAAWVEGEADLLTICECMCGGAGCGDPV